MTSHSINDPAHPIWPFLRFVIVCGMMLAVMYANASKFDETELTAWIQFILAFGGLKGAEVGLGKMFGKKQCDHPDHQKDEGNEDK